MNVSQFLTHSSSGGFHLHSNLGLSSCVECGQRFFILKLRDTSQGFPRKDLSVLKICPFLSLLNYAELLRQKIV